MKTLSRGSGFRVLSPGQTVRPCISPKEEDVRKHVKKALVEDQSLGTLTCEVRTVMVVRKGSTERCIDSYVLPEPHWEKHTGHLPVFHQR